ncbi:hypothetical protein SAMN05444483_104231 [Salegentibacter echinorum]|uniref:Uncharacterized protein n=1 Tax=Salegentibacter echinorum TaxID=1073325 RepID=A0A1M5GMW5_SALEC|nr:hypothetical protein [Salegentibacter echinorum]SHG05036.1 hypothetical protein SAMN05444483_104231 [Salegentibacter echinorum]
MKKGFSILLFFMGLGLMPAQNINDYKYVIVPDTYEFSKEEDQYQLNSLTQFLFEKYGFEAYMKSEEKPQDLQDDICKGLKANVIEDSGLFVTKLRVQLEDCRGNMVFESDEGRSREKDYKKAYHEALRDAFKTVAALDYNYTPAEVAAAAPQANNPKPSSVEEAEVSSSVPEEEPGEEDKNATPAEVVVQNPTNSKEFREKQRGNNEAVLADIIMLKKDNQEFTLKKNSNGYALFQKNGTEPIAVLVSSSDKNSFIYKSLTRQGVARFNSAGNLIVEYLNNETNKPVSITYKLLNK